MMTEKKNYTVSLIILTSLFFMWGFITCMNDILIPYLKNVFKLNYFQAMLIQFSFFGAYFIGSVIYFAISSIFGDPINKIGYKNGIVLGLFTSGVGTLLFYPAAELVSYPFFLSALFILALGFTILQIAANPYVAILGTPESASSRLNLSQAFNSLGTTIAPLIGGYLIFTYFASNHTVNADSVKIPYLFFTGLFFLMAIAFIFIKLPVFTNPDVIEKGAGALKYRQLIFGIIAIFMYVGGEVSVGSMMINFLGLKEIAGLKESDASVYVAFYWGGLMIGRFLGAISLSDLNKKLKYIAMAFVPAITFLIIFYLKGIEIASVYSIFLLLNLGGFLLGKSMPARTMFVFSLIGALLIITGIFTHGKVAMWSIIGAGLFNSIMWSNIFTLSIAGLGKHTAQGSSLLVMAILGGALLPLIMGLLADTVGVQNSFVVPVIAYIYLAFYGLHGYKPWKKHLVQNS